MVVTKEFLDILACPQCKGEVVPNEQQDKLICNTCQLAYPIRDDIPVMLIDEADPLKTT